MKTNILTIATGLSDRDLLARLHVLAGREREACAHLVAHLTALDSRPSLYAAQGCGSLFTCCTQALRLSEDAACSRIEAARACRRFPLILDLLDSGELNLTAVRLLGRHLTPENHQTILAKAKHRSRQQQETLEKLRRLQALLRREIPDGDPAAIFDRAPTLLLEAVEKRKLGAAKRPASSMPIRPGTDRLVRKPDAPSRYIPRAVKRAVWRRDAGQCAFLAPSRQRCSERTAVSGA